MSAGHFSLRDDEALVIKMPATSAAYQAVQLADMWFASLEHGNQVSSLTTKQSHLADDGAYYYVISPTDPGYANWLDTGLLTRGVFLMRWDGVQGKLSDSEHPAGMLTTLSQLPEQIPGFKPTTEAQRTATRAARRKHLQLRANR